MAYGDDDLYAQISSPPTEDVKKTLEELGFTVEEEGDQNKNTRTLVKGKKTALLYEEFASTRDASERINNVALANSMVQLLQVVMANPALFAAIGPAQAIKLINQIGDFLGFYEDWELETMPGASPEEQQAQAQEQIGQMLAQMKQAIDQEIAAAVTPVAEGVQQLGQVVSQIAPVVPQLAKGVQELTQALQQMAQQIQGMQQGTTQALEAIGQKDAQQDEVIGKLVGLIQQAMPPPPMPPQQMAPPSPLVPA